MRLQSTPGIICCIYALSILAIPGCSTGSDGMQQLVIAENNRFLVREDGSPFVWIGETNWFFSQLPPEIIDSMLDRRTEQGYTIMFVSCRQNLYNGKGGTGSIENPNESWWLYLDEYIEKCERRGLYVGITLGWWGKAMQNSKEALYEYGKWVGNRYKDQKNIVWLTLGEAGSHLRKKTIPDEKLEALVKGIRDGDTGEKLLTVHADYRRGTSISNDAELSDFNNWQTSQWGGRKDLPRNDDRHWTVWEAMEFDYNQVYDGKPKPTLDSEAWYENNKDFCGATAFHIRRRAYFTIFAGAFGHTYGAGGIWDGLLDRESCSGTALEALNYPGAEDMGHLSSLLHGLGENFLKIIPRQDLIAAGNSDDYDTHIQACTAEDGSFALVYSASNGEYYLNMDVLKHRVNAYIWFNPGNGQFGTRFSISPDALNDRSVFDPPGNEGPGNDWVLVIGKPSFIRSLKSKAMKFQRS